MAPFAAEHVGACARILAAQPPFRPYRLDEETARALLERARGEDGSVLLAALRGTEAGVT